MANYTKNLNLFKYDTVLDSNVPFSIKQALNNNWDILDERCGSQRNIGEIVASTLPLTDAGLHLLDGSLIQGDGIYSQFVTYISGLVSDYPNLFTTESNWQSSITSYDVCGKFVYDSINNTVRLPKITGIVEGTTDLTALGDLVRAGLPEIVSNGAHTHTRGTMEIKGSLNNSASDECFYKNTATASGCIVAKNATSSHRGTNSNSGTTTRGFEFQASKNWTGATSSDGSHSHTFNGITTTSTVQPQTIKVLYYIVIANSTKTSIQVDIDEIATDFNGKADVDLSNCTKPYIVETYKNGASWYRIYSDGWCEQGGYVATAGSVTYLKPYLDTNYTLLATGATNSSNAVQYRQIVPNAYTATGFTGTTSSGVGLKWYACGYIR